MSTELHRIEKLTRATYLNAYADLLALGHTGRDELLERARARVEETRKTWREVVAAIAGRPA